MEFIANVECYKRRLSAAGTVPVQYTLVPIHLFTFPSIRPVSSDLLRILYVPGTLQSPRDTAVRNPDIVHYLFG